MDFTLKTYKLLLETLASQNYSFQTFQEFIENLKGKSIVFRHDVDKLPGNALRMAELEADLGIKSSYYFRSVKESFDEVIIKKIAGMRHEVGYHYENLATIGKEMKLRIQDTGNRGPNGNFYELAIKDFEKNLKKLREIVPITTICMHGSPTSKFDSRDLWKKYNYRDYGIIGEPYFDIDFSKVLYLTDTGRRWDGDKFNIRDRVLDNEMETGDRQGEFAFAKRRQLGLKPATSQSLRDNAERPPDTRSLQPEFKHSFHSTFDIIEALEKNLLPDQIMINTHPQRWTNNPILWTKELVWQNVKNLVKKFYVMET